MGTVRETRTRDDGIDVVTFDVVIREWRQVSYVEEEDSAVNERRRAEAFELLREAIGARAYKALPVIAPTHQRILELS